MWEWSSWAFLILTPMLTCQDSISLSCVKGARICPPLAL